MKPAHIARSIIFTTLAGLWTYFILEFFEKTFEFFNPFHIITALGYVFVGILMVFYQFKKSAHFPSRMIKPLRFKNILD